MTTENIASTWKTVEIRISSCGWNKEGRKEGGDQGEEVYFKQSHVHYTLLPLSPGVPLFYSLGITSRLSLCITSCAFSCIWQTADMKYANNASTSDKEEIQIWQAWKKERRYVENKKLMINAITVHLSDLLFIFVRWKLMLVIMSYIFSQFDMELHNISCGITPEVQITEMHGMISERWIAK